MIADRVKGLEPSGIRQIFDKVQSARNPIDLIMGEPDFDIPLNIKEAGITAIREGKNKYTPTAGIKPLREKLAHDLSARGIFLDEVMVTSGVSGGILLSCLTLINPGDEVIIPDPYFVMYKYVVSLCGGIPVMLDTYPDFHIQKDRLLELITSRTKLIILNSPNNPTGAVYTPAEIKMVARLAEAHNLVVISDEIYEKFIYDDVVYLPIGTIYKSTITLRGFAKSYAMTGWRLGYACGPAEILRNMITMQQYSFTCAPSVAQYAALEALSTDISEHIRNYQDKRDYIYNALKDDFKVEKPEGAFYIFPEAGGMTSKDFLRIALSKELFIIPGDAFSEKGTHFRISFAAPLERLERGVEVLKTMI